MKKCQPDLFSFFLVDEPRRKKQKHLFLMVVITLESTLSSCWDVVSYVCMNLWCHCKEQILKPQSSWGFPLLPSCTASAHLHQCETLPMGFSSKQCLPCDGIDNCTKKPSVSCPRPWCSHGAALTQSLKHYFCVWTSGTAFLSQSHVGTPSYHVLMGADCLKNQSELLGNAPQGKSVFPSLVAFIQEWWGLETYKWAHNGHLLCHVSSSLLASITTGVWAAPSSPARQKRLGSHPAYILACWASFSHIDHSVHFF